MIQSNENGKHSEWRSGIEDWMIPGGNGVRKGICMTRWMTRARFCKCIWGNPIYQT